VVSLSPLGALSRHSDTRDGHPAFTSLDARGESFLRSPHCRQQVKTSDTRLEPRRSVGLPTTARAILMTRGHSVPLERLSGPERLLAGDGTKPL
jgi:hypothetical protein